MSKDTRRFMRLLVFFDLPTTSRGAKRAYVRFRRFLLKDGYDMLQWSVYGRVINGSDRLEGHMKRLNQHLPSKGSVRCLVVSEKQFTSMKLLVGTYSKQEKKVGAQQLVLL
jgi:CRISPR-associated protein Cas2